MVPPSPSALSPEVTPEMRQENDRRIAYEDSLRNDYIARCQKAQHELIMNTGNKTLCSIYDKTWGNYQTISDFVKYAQEKQQETKAVDLLQVISDKDLRDIRLEVLQDHFDYTPGLEQSVISLPPDLYKENILSPRISNEMIVPWRKILSECFTKEEAQKFHDQPKLLVDWVKQNITVNDELNPQRIPISPTGVLKARKADRHSRDIFFVAMARSLGIASQIHPVTGKVQYFEKEWIDVDFEAEKISTTEIGYLDIRYRNYESTPNPKYYTHFSIKKFDGTSFHLLSYDAQDPGIDDGMMLATFEQPLPLEAGNYILTAGNRLPDGTALTHSEFFTIKSGKTTQVNLVLRESKNELQILGQFDAGDLTQSMEGYYILGLLDQGSEPTTHAMQDISAFRNDFEKSGIPMLFLFDSETTLEKFKLRNFNQLPDNIRFGLFNDSLLQKVINNLHIDNPTYPIFIIANANQHNVVFLSQGYTIGLGEQLLKTIANK